MELIHKMLSVTSFSLFFSGKCLLSFPSFPLPPHLAGSHRPCPGDCLTLSPPTFPAPSPHPALHPRQIPPFPPHPGSSCTLSLIAFKYYFHREHFLVQKSSAYSVWLLRCPVISSHPIHLTVFSVTSQHMPSCNKTRFMTVVTNIPCFFLFM